MLLLSVSILIAIWTVVVIVTDVKYTHGYTAVCTVLQMAATTVSKMSLRKCGSL
jgi:hypothetical protein